MLTQRLMTPEEQIAEARWWVNELSNDLSVGATPRLLQKAKFHLFDLQACHHAGQLPPEEIIVDDKVTF